MENAKYDAVTLIELVESKPCLWDKTNEENKNKIARDKAWMEIIRYLEDGYDELSSAEKKKVGDNIMKRWGTIRDGFMRSLRTKTGQGAKKKYLYGEHLTFLLKISQKQDTDSNYLNTDESEDLDVGGVQTPIPVPDEDEPGISAFTEQPLKQTLINRKSTTSKKSNREIDPIETEILAEIKRPKSVEQKSDQETLMLSFVPYLRDMSEEELMDLQMETLNTIKRIKQRRKCTNALLSGTQQISRDHADFLTPSQPANITNTSTSTCSSINRRKCTKQQSSTPNVIQPGNSTSKTFFELQPVALESVQDEEAATFSELFSKYP